ncbi:hypothetical protein PPL_12192 [Heterostelium album PN500]|uniref:Cell division topological specificity factor n=1 Tax=Heterostelium pallidum (strain ATCC 26659 / Pp 5 / PN500) TaxID=670386 RepID=D3BLY7_HETP5|nr:hypothetical protein PPL_12192 [Heterostelium album PN500]EFA77588.1 hypothetical protein PPL_12192 [Heterostelium album PN500]|eukprot:XP_020429716.1 hypothetical protein PPL_12192 [Heterostelium album PN500]
MSLKQILARVFQVKESQVTANVAKERMQIFLSEQRGARLLKDENLNQIKGEVLQVVSKYWNVNMNDVTFTFKKSEDQMDLDVFEMQVTLPSEAFKRHTSTTPKLSI